MRKWVISLLLITIVSFGSGIVKVLPVPTSGTVTLLSHGEGS